MTRVLLVDDQPLVRAGIAMILSVAPDIEVVAECNDGLEAVDATARLQPDVLVMDVRMPGADGLEATRRIAGATHTGEPSPRILVLTTFDDEDAMLAILRAGASGFLLKHNAPSDLVEAVRQVAAGNAWIDPLVASAVIGSLGTPTSSDGPTGAALASLTPRETEILGHIARGLSNGEISELLGLSEATVKTHVSRILMKCGCRDRAQAVVVAYEAGLVRPGR